MMCCAVQNDYVGGRSGLLTHPSTRPDFSGSGSSQPQHCQIAGALPSGSEAMITLPSGGVARIILRPHL